MCYIYSHAKASSSTSKFVIKSKKKNYFDMDLTKLIGSIYNVSIQTTERLIWKMQIQSYYKTMTLNISSWQSFNLDLGQTSVDYKRKIFLRLFNRFFKSADIFPAIYTITMKAVQVVYLVVVFIVAFVKVNSKFGISSYFLYFNLT